MVGFCYDCSDYTALDTDDHCLECGSHRVTLSDDVYLCNNCGAFTIPDATNRCVSCGSRRIKSAAATRRDNFNIEPLPKNQSEEDSGPAAIIALTSVEKEHRVSQNGGTNVETPTETAQATGDQDGVETWELWFARVVMLIVLLGLVVGAFRFLMQLLGLK